MAACVPQPAVLVHPRGSGPTGGNVEVRGENFGSSTAEVRWNGVDGRLLGKGTGPSFTVPITIPDAAEGLYTLVVVLRGAQGEVLDTTRAPFQVTNQSSSSSTPLVPPPQASTAGSSSSGDAGSMALGAGIAMVAGAGGAVVGRLLLRRRAPGTT